MKNKGLHQHRLKNNPLEKSFAEEWEKINTGGLATLEDLLGIYRGEASGRDREIAATIIQWLGSPLGQFFIKDVMGEQQAQAISDQQQSFMAAQQQSGFSYQRCPYCGR